MSAARKTSPKPQSASLVFNTDSKSAKAVRFVASASSDELDVDEPAAEAFNKSKDGTGDLLNDLTDPGD
ncbi:MAG TPA: hypothetical protein VL171_16410 [Verrucomicrobiae bacterium]|nr:hypothetical protein [Verrucomicrobiae bacterium]